MYTPGFGNILPAAEQIMDLYHLETRAAGRTGKKNRLIMGDQPACQRASRTKR